MQYPNKRESFFSTSSKDFNSPTWCQLDWLAWDWGPKRLSGEFKKSGDYVVEHLSRGEESGHPDGQFMPVAYLYRHSLELMLKHLVDLGIRAELIMISSDESAVKLHNLVSLWDFARPALEERWPDGDKTVIRNTEALIREFQKMDKSGQNFRYSHNLEGKSVLPKMPPIVDIKEFSEKFAGIFNFLSGCAIGLEEAADYVAEYYAECAAEREPYY